MESDSDADTGSRVEVEPHEADRELVLREMLGVCARMHREADRIHNEATKQERLVFVELREMSDERQG